MAEDPAAHLTGAVPFAELLAPFLGPAREEFRREAGSAASLLEARAAADLEAALERYLAGFALPTFYQEFALCRALRGALPWAGDHGSDEAYRDFCAGWSGEPLLQREYPELPALLRTWSSGWARAQAALVRRAESDWPILTRRFFAGGTDRQPSTAIAAVTPYCSDPHHGGQSVTILAAAAGGGAGRLVVYKPRPLDMEAWFYGLLAWANDRGFSCPFRIPAIAPRRGYGWMEFIPPAPCATPAEVEAFYRRAGGLALLAALLQGTDLHRENLIAHGGQPVLVDLETLLHPRLPASSGGLGLADTLPDTGLLPVRGGAAGPDFSALGPGEAIETPFPALACTAANTDGMSLEYRAYRAPARANLPVLGERRQPAARYASAIADGFGEMLDLVIRQRAALSLAGSPLAAGAALTGRRVIRSSNSYGLLLQRSLEPVHMRAPGGSRRRFFERSLPGACAEELEALEAMNVPHLTGSCRVAASQVAQRLSSVGPDDWKPCVEWIRAALAEAGPGAARPASEHRPVSHRV